MHRRKKNLSCKHACTLSILLRQCIFNNEECSFSKQNTTTLWIKISLKKYNWTIAWAAFVFTNTNQYSAIKQITQAKKCTKKQDWKQWLKYNNPCKCDKLLSPECNNNEAASYDKQSQQNLTA